MNTVNQTNAFVRENYARLSYQSYVINDNALYLEVPKAASTTVKHVLCHILNIELPSYPLIGCETNRVMAIHYKEFNKIPSLCDFNEFDQNRLLTSNDVARFCVVRNPYSRLLSAWADKIRQLEPSFLLLIDKIRRDLKLEYQNPSFKDFVEWLSYDVENVSMDPHFESMTRLLYVDAISYTDVVKTENISNDLQKLFNKIGIPSDCVQLLRKYYFNESFPISKSDYYDEHLLNLVHKIHKDDFDMFGYSADCFLDFESRNMSYNRLESVALESIREKNYIINFLKSILAENNIRWW